jgi:type IV pilus assembly protein PilA
MISLEIRPPASASSGFTLLELMTVVATIGILGAIAVSAYDKYMVRSRVSEAMVAVETAKNMVVDSSTTVPELAAGAAAWNNQAGGAGAASKYVESVLVDGTTGIITVTLDNRNVGIPNGRDSLTLTPYRITDTAGDGTVTGLTLGTALSTGTGGNLDWSCASATNTVSVARGIPSPPGTLAPHLAPSECR